MRVASNWAKLAGVSSKKHIKIYTETFSLSLTVRAMSEFHEERSGLPGPL